jgi:hypothetical protein
MKFNIKRKFFSFLKITLIVSILINFIKSDNEGKDIDIDDSNKQLNNNTDLQQMKNATNFVDVDIMPVN